MGFKIALTGLTLFICATCLAQNFRDAENIIFKVGVTAIYFVSLVSIPVGLLMAIWEFAL